MPKKTAFHLLLRRFLVVLIVYGVIIAVYFFIGLRFLDVFLAVLFHQNLIAYALLGLVLIFIQGSLLETLTAFLLEKIKPEDFE